MKNNLVILQGVCRVWSNPPIDEGAENLGLLDSSEPIIIFGDVAKTGWRSYWVVCLTRYGICQIHRDFLRTAF